MSVLAVGWEPELRGILTVFIGVVVLMGSTYLILGTNIGARLGFLVAFSALAGWMFIMGAIWWAYGIGLQGPMPTWEPVPGRTILQGPQALSQSGALTEPVQVAADMPFPEQALAIDERFTAEGWEKLDESAPSYGQAGSAAGELLEESGALSAGRFEVVNVFDKGGERYPNFFDGKVDLLAFWHKPHHVVVEVAPLIQQRTEPGRAPAPAVIDEDQPHQYVYMIRDMGARRQPAGFITGGSLIVFLVCCWLLHRRDRRVQVNRGQLALPARA